MSMKILCTVFGVLIIISGNLPVHAAAKKVPLKQKKKLPKIDCQLEPLGFANRAVSYDNNFAVIAPGTDGKGKFFYISYYQNPSKAEILAYDWQRKKLHRYPSDSNGLYGLLRASNGVIYAGGIHDGNLYALQPGSKKLENLGNLGVSYIWDLAETPDGKIYGGCFGKKKAGKHTSTLLEYNPATKKLKNAGVISEDRAYLRSLAAAPNGRLWCAIGCPALLFVYNPQTGEKKQLLPKKYQAYSCTGRPVIRDNYVYVSMYGGANAVYDKAILVFDAKTEKLVRELQAPAPLNPIPGNYKKGFYGNSTGHPHPSGVYFYDAATNVFKIVKEGNIGSCKYVEDNRYLHGLQDQNYYCYDLKEKRFLCRTRLTPPDTTGMQIRCLTTGPDGNIYGGVYINQHLWKFKVDTRQSVELGRCRFGGGQIDSIASGGGRVWMGSYTRAHILSYDHQKPWNPGVKASSNPRDYGPVGKGQYKTDGCDILWGPDGKVYMGSFPVYSSGSTRAMSILDPKTGDIDVYTKLSPVSLACNKELVFGSGKRDFFVFDPKLKKVIFRTKNSFVSMVGLPDGSIAATDGKLFYVFDPGVNKFTLKKDLKVGKINTLLLGSDGNIYGIGSVVFRLDSKNKWAVQLLWKKGGKFLAEDRSGKLYFARNDKLFRLTVKQPSQ
ncbi:MAG: hypothetical protein K8S55_11460 [Phycisphaerae bacterium]|nr:hypothetical protein [Phycisphaerae bacterium]